MEKLPQHVLDGVWKALQEPAPPVHAWRYQGQLARFLDVGWAYGYQVEDFLIDADRRFDRYRLGFDVEELVKALGFEWISVTDRPNRRSIMVSYIPAIPVMDMALLLLRLEKLGFSIDPSYLIDRLAPALSKKKLITDTEVQVFWGERNRGKCEISLTSADPLQRLGEIPSGKFANGYKFTAMRRNDGSLYTLTVTGPGYRERREPVETVCPHCKYTWYRGDPDSSAAHRRQHKRRMAVLDPKPHQLMLEAMKTEPEPELVTSASPPWKHQEMYDRALKFKREEGYDFVQWQSRKGEEDSKVRGFLLTESDGTIVGAIAFRWREWTDAPASWGLQFVWIAPPFRRKGILSRRWKMFRERFGNFVVEGPVSDSMSNFLKRSGFEGDVG